MTTFSRRWINRSMCSSNPTRKPGPYDHHRLLIRGAVVTKVCIVAELVSNADVWIGSVPSNSAAHGNKRRDIAGSV